jgi:hypothetical protein
MSTSPTCAICGKAMDAHQWRQLHIIKRATAEEKHAHPECVTRGFIKAKAEGFLHEGSTSIP